MFNFLQMNLILMTPLRLPCPAMWLLVRCMQLFLPSVSTVFAQLITNNLTVFLMRCILLWKCFLSTHVHYFVGTSLIVATSFVYTWHRLDHPASIPTPMNPLPVLPSVFFFKTAIWSAYHLYRKPENSRENSNGTVYPGGNFPEKK